MYIIDDKDFPKEYLISLDNEPHYVARVLIFQHSEKFNAEICILHKESHKIVKHVDTLYHFIDPQDSLDSAVQRLALFLKGEKS